MAQPRAESWLQSRMSWDCQCGMLVSARRRATCCGSMQKRLSIRCSNRSLFIATAKARGDATDGLRLKGRCFHHQTFKDRLEMNTQDEKFMRRALELAREGVGLTAPNPAVGAVLVDAKGKIVGSDFHTYDGLKH